MITRSVRDLSARPRSTLVFDAVVFDLDETLCTYRRHGREVLDEAFDRAGVDPCFGIEDYYGVYEEYAGVADTVEDQRAACFAALAEEAGRAAEEGRAVARTFAELRDHSDVRLHDGAEDVIATLAQDHRIGLVTNGAPDMQAIKLEAIGLADAFEVLVHGGHDAPAKPSPEPFHLALESLGVEPARAIHVGDSLDADVAGAKAAGLAAAWIENGDALDRADGGREPDYVLSSVAELLTPPWTRPE